MPQKLALKGKIALVTGASRGIGAAVAKRYANEGAHVIMVARTVGSMEEIDDEIQKDGNGSATIVPLNLLELNKIDSLALTIAEKFGKLDVLVGNAAMLGSLSPVSHISNDIWDDVIKLNLTANWRLIRAFDQLLRKSEYGRAVFVTSGVTNADFPYWGAYATSKSALEKMVKTYASEMVKTNVKANLVNPGIVKTNLRAEAFPGENPDTHPKPETVTDVFVELAAENLKKNGEIVKAY